MNPKMLVVAIGALVIIAASAFLLTKNSTSNVAPESAVTPTTAALMESETPTASPSTTMTESGNVKEFIVTGSPFKFVPATITVKKGDTVKITFKNLGGTHDFVIDELGVKTKTLPAGGEEVVQFVASKAGTFEYYCSVGNHRAMGMVGKITVE